MGKTDDGVYRPLQKQGLVWILGFPSLGLTLLIPLLPVNLDPGPRSPFASQLIIHMANSTLAFICFLSLDEMAPASGINAESL